MRTMLLMMTAGLLIGCGGNATTTPAKPVPKMDLDAKDQKNAGELAPGP